MRFLGLLLLSALVLLAGFFSAWKDVFKGEKIGKVIGTYFVGLAIVYVWVLAMYGAIMLIIHG